MNVLSLFDGLGGAKLALQSLNIPIENYYASEIDKYALVVNEHNNPDTIMLGDVTKIDYSSLPKIDLLIAGFPCQAFSIAGNRQGFDDPRGQLFFEVIKAMKALQPKYFLFENTRMKKSFLDEITALVGVEPIMINSALLTAQRRIRMYWTNIPNITQPSDRGVKLKDILEDESEGIIKSHGIFKDKNDKSQCIDASYYKGVDNHGQRTMLRPIRIGIIGNGGQGERIYSTEGKSVTLSANGGGRGAKTGLYKPNETVRKLTPLECEKLQGVPSNYTNVKGISTTQKYRMLGNGFTIPVIAHILKNMEVTC